MYNVARHANAKNVGEVFLNGVLTQDKQKDLVVVQCSVDRSSMKHETEEKKEYPRQARDQSFFFSRGGELKIKIMYFITRGEERLFMIL